MENQVSVIGLTAHMWHGRTADELGKRQLAKDIYEEVLANELDPKTEDRLLDPLFAQVRHYWFAILAKEKGDQFLEEATVWLKEYERKSRRYEGYQGVMLLVAKTLLDEAERSTGTQKSRRVEEAMRLLTETARIPSPHQQEAIALRQKYGKGAVAVKPTEAKTFDEAVAMADSAASMSQWREAIDGYSKALEMSGAVKDKERVAAVANSLAGARVMMAGEILRDGKPDEALTALCAVLAEQKDSTAAPAAAAMAAAAILAQYAALPATAPVEKQKAMAQLQEIVAFADSQWPGKPEADDARLAMGKVSLVERRYDDAIRVFEKVNPKSPRYPAALYLSGLAQWQKYLLGKRGETAGDAKELSATRAKAVELATASLAEITKAAEGPKSQGRQYSDTLLLLAEMALEGEQPKEAVTYIQPLMDQVRAAKLDPKDTAALRVLFIATRAFLAAGETERASEAGMMLADLEADAPLVNRVLVDFAHSLDLERKKADAELTKAQSAADAKQVEAAKKRLASTKRTMGTLLKKLATRKEYSLKELRNIAELCHASGLAAEAKTQYRAVLERAAQPTRSGDEKGAAQARAATTWARAQLVGLLRTEGKFDAAYTEVKKLIQEHPNALEPKLELGRILQGWAQQDPRHYDEAVKQWVTVRNLLQSMRKKPQEYYEVIYNAAFCLHQQARQSGEKVGERNTQAYQLLKSAMILNPSLSGPDMVAKYKALSDQLEAAGIQPARGAGKR